jgi:hypothetical protein
MLAPANARAEAEGEATLQPPLEIGQRAFGLVARGGSDGAYGGVRVGSSRFGVEATGGFAPVLALEKDIQPWWPYNHAQYFSTAQVNGELFAFPWRPSRRVQLGLDVHYAYNTLLLNGVGTAFRFDIALSRALVGDLRIGGTWFPVATDEVRKNSQAGVEINRFLTDFAGFASFELAWFPM